MKFSALRALLPELLRSARLDEATDTRGCEALLRRTAATMADYRGDIGGTASAEHEMFVTLERMADQIDQTSSDDVREKLLEVAEFIGTECILYDTQANKPRRRIRPKI